MSDPVRLLDEGSGAERELLDAWGSMRAPTNARARALELASAGVVLTATSVAGASATATAGAATKASTSIVVLKWFTAVGLAAAIGGASVVAVHELGPSPSISPVRTTVGVAPAELRPAHARPSAPAVLPTSEAIPAISVDALPSVKLPAQRGSQPPPDSELAAQLRGVDVAREALVDGDPARALRNLDAFDARYPSSALAEEAAALRFDVLLANGDRLDAMNVGRAFVARWPSSPYAARLRRAMEANP